MTTEQDVERVARAIRKADHDGNDDGWHHEIYLAKVALSAMPDKHEKAVKVLREALKKAHRKISFQMKSTIEAEFIDDALATVDEMMGK